MATRTSRRGRPTTRPTASARWRATCSTLMRALGSRAVLRLRPRPRRARRAPARARSSARGTRTAAARHLADADDVRAHDDGIRARLLPLVLPDPARAAARAPDRRRPVVLSAHASSAAGARAAPRSSTRARSPSTNAASRARPRSTRCARTTAPRRRSTSRTIAPTPRAASNVPCACSGASAASCTACSLRSRIGRQGRARTSPGRALPTGHYIPEEAPRAAGRGDRSLSFRLIGACARATDRYSRAQRYADDRRTQ